MLKGLKLLRSILKFVSLALLLALSLINALVVTSVVRDSGSGWQNFALLSALWLALLAIHTNFFFRKPFIAKPKVPFSFHQVPDGRAAELQEEAKNLKNLKEIDADQAKVFATAIGRPEQFRRRVVEEYTPDRRTLLRTATVDIEIPRRLEVQRDDAEVYLPVIVNKKGDLLDDFQMQEISGEGVTWLSYRQYLSLVARVLRRLLLAAYRLPEGADLPEAAAKAELMALHAIVRRTDTRNPVPVDYSGADEIAKLADAAPALRTVAVLFVRQLTSKYALVVRVKNAAGRHHKFRYSFTFTPAVKFARTGSKQRWSVGGFFRLLFGARPVALNLDIANASTCESYHLHVHAPNDLYLARQEVVGLDDILKRTAEKAPTMPHCRFRRRLGQPHMHFYSRFMPAFGPEEKPMVRLHFFEVPPGSVFRATLTAMAGLFVLWLVGFVSSRHADPGTDAAAFLLAFPALAATWLGFDSPSRKLLEGTLSARLSMTVTALLSIVGTGLFMLHRVNPSYNWPQLPSDVSFFGITDVAWAAAVAAAFVNASYIAYLCFIRTWQYSHLLVKPLD
ncbi:hypothetical protein ACFPM7_20165 [Actinokineospora guangxiensis]|uniref:Uncharacterized protein n=1 Tax=Actinokineospora guangxiensis TaxID=1490288 RepID=A0ABW0ER92_9PSEU